MYERGSFISKEEATMLKGVAVLLMVFHHLFGFPERISCEYFALFDFSFFHAETILAYFGQICIALFAFSSGYGMLKKAMKLNWTKKENVIVTVARQTLLFYFRFWLVFVLFIPLGFTMGVYAFYPAEFFKNLVVLSASYNGGVVVHLLLYKISHAVSCTTMGDEKTGSQVQICV